MQLEIRPLPKNYRQQVNPGLFIEIPAGYGLFDGEHLLATASSRQELEEIMPCKPR